jgi:hypothetical protein
MWPCIVTNFFIIKPTRCTNFTNLFWHETLHVSDSLFTVHSAMVYIIQVCRQLSSRTRMELTIVYDIWIPWHRGLFPSYVYVLKFNTLLLVGEGGGVRCGAVRLRHCATSRRVAGSTTVGVMGNFYWLSPTGPTTVLGLTQPLTELRILSSGG